MNRLYILLIAVSMFAAPVCGQTMDWLCHPGEYSQIQYVGNDLFKVRSMQGKWGLLNNKGRMLIDTAYDSITPFVENRGLLLGNGGRRLLGIIDSRGEVVKDFSGEKYYVSSYPHFKDGRLVFIQDGLYGYMNTKGEVSIEPTFSMAAPFQNGVAVVAFGEGDFGLINKSGMSMIVSDEYYSFISSPVDGMVFVIRKSRKGGNQFALMHIDGASLKKKKTLEDGMYIRVSDDMTKIECQLGHRYHIDNQLRIAGASYQVSLPAIPEEPSYYVTESSRVLSKVATENGLMITYLGNPIINYSFPDVATYDRSYAVVRSKDGKVGVLKLNPTADITIKTPDTPVIFNHNQENEVILDVALVDVDPIKIKWYRNDQGDLTKSTLEHVNGAWQLRMPYFKASDTYGKEETEPVDIAITYDGFDWVHQTVDVKSVHQPGYDVRLRGATTADASGNVRLTIDVSAIGGDENTKGTVTINDGAPISFAGRGVSIPHTEKVSTGERKTFRYKVCVQEEGCPAYTTDVAATVSGPAKSTNTKTKKDIIIN